MLWKEGKGEWWEEGKGRERARWRRGACPSSLPRVRVDDQTEQSGSHHTRDDSDIVQFIVQFIPA